MPVTVISDVVVMVEVEYTLKVVVLGLLDADADSVLLGVPVDVKERVGVLEALEEVELLAEEDSELVALEADVVTGEVSVLEGVYGAEDVSETGVLELGGAGVSVDVAGAGVLEVGEGEGVSVDVPGDGVVLAPEDGVGVPYPEGVGMLEGVQE